MLAPNGNYVVAGGTMRQLFQAMLRRRRNSPSGGQQAHVIDLQHSREDLIFLNNLLESGKLVTIIDEVYPLSEMAEAFRTYENEHARGKIVITMNGNL
jgi:NADPH:quinone reductase-like Zn-dependent oxidoreductase